MACMIGSAIFSLNIFEQCALRVESFETRFGQNFLYLFCKYLVEITPIRRFLNIFESESFLKFADLNEQLKSLKLKHKTDVCEKGAKKKNASSVQTCFFADAAYIFMQR